MIKSGRSGLLCRKIKLVRCNIQTATSLQPPSSVSFVKPKIAIIIPAYNEEKNIERVLTEVARLRKARPRWKITTFVINDGSTDGTERLLSDRARLYCAKFISLTQNLGIGKAVQTGFKLAEGCGADVALQLDGDGQHPAELIPVLVGPVLAGKADVAVGSRYIRGAGGNVSTSLRQAGTAFFSALLSLSLGLRLKDSTSGFRAFNRRCLTYLASQYPDDYPEVESFVVLARKGASFLEIPVFMRPRTGGVSSITPLRSVYYMVKVAFGTLLALIRPLPPLQDLAQRPKTAMVSGHYDLKSRPSL